MVDISCRADCSWQPVTREESRAPSHITVAWEGKRPNSKCPLLPSSSPTSHAEHDATWYGSLVRWDQLSRLCPLPDSRVPTACLLLGWWEKQKKALMLCKHFSAITKTSLCFQHVFQHKSKTYSRAGLYDENQLYPRQARYVSEHLRYWQSTEIAKFLGNTWSVVQICYISARFKNT